MGTPGPLEGAERLRDWPKQEDLHDAQVEPICRKYLELRYQMLPYIYSTVEQAHRTGLPLMRSLWIAWPDDPKAVTTGDEYMWGDHFLVAPVLEAVATSRKTYLPAGAWWDFWSNQRHEGGTEVAREVDLETIPLYVLAGAIVPMGPVRQYTSEPNEEPTTLRIYPGANGRFSWYEDDGSSFRYRQGESTRIECAWDDAARKLTLTVKTGKKPWSGRKVSIQSMDQGVKKLVTLTNRVTAVKL
jgi:alpha-glucosidase/alpha-D-xyloside xylohydrolase